MHSQLQASGEFDTVSRFRTPDGGLITLEAPGYDLSDPWSATARITANDPYRVLPTGRQVRGLDIAYAGNYDFVIAEVLRGRVVDRLNGQGGQFLIARGREQGLILWRGIWHEAAMWISDPNAPSAQALGYFDRLIFMDTPVGLVIRSQSSESEIVETHEVVKHIPGVGYLDIKTAKSGLNLVPTWSGAETHTGEVWRKTHEAASGEPALSVFVHATRTTVAIISGEGEQKSIEEPRLTFLDRLTHLSWIER